jgi:NAD-dependent SIR2 family protein deacetylase
MSLARARELLAAAEAIVIAAGAGMGVDSGLPDFRGPEGFWRAYPPYKKLGLDFMQLANPRWFATDPHLAWGFYGHRLRLYRATTPHDGFLRLRDLDRPTFVFTSNIDGQFQKAGFADVAEVHGSIHHLQCTQNDCGITPADSLTVMVDEATMRAADPLPACPRCGSLARPNVLMFGDGGWDGARTDGQLAALQRWLDATAARRRVVIECGAGTGVPTVRAFSERLHARGTTLIRINVREPEAPSGAIGLSLGAKEAILALRSEAPA